MADDWCGWPRIHGPHWVDGRACRGVLSPPEAGAEPATPDWQTWAKQVAIDAAIESGRASKQHVCGPSCVCPVHGTPLLYNARHDQHACADPDCVHAHGIDITGQPWPSFTCPVCGATSHHPKDIEHGYCGRCHDWTGDTR